MTAQSGGRLLSQPAIEDMATGPLSNDPFPPLPPEPCDSLLFQNKKHKTNSFKRSAAADFSTSSSASQSTIPNDVNNLSSNHHPISSSPPACLIIREDHKAILFNFINTDLLKWTALVYRIRRSLKKNHKKGRLL